MSSPDIVVVKTWQYEGQWKVQTGDAEIFKGQGHKSQVSDMVLCGDNLVTCSMDDTVRFTSVQTLEYG